MGKVYNFEDVFFNGKELNYLMDLMREYEKANYRYRVNDIRMKQVKQAFEKVGFMFNDDHDVKVKLVVAEEDKTSAAIYVESISLAIIDVKALLDILKDADTLDVTPLLNGNIEVCIGFRGIAVEISPSKK